MTVLIKHEPRLHRVDNDGGILRETLGTPWPLKLDRRQQGGNRGGPFEAGLGGVPHPLLSFFHPFSSPRKWTALSSSPRPGIASASAHLHLPPRRRLPQPSPSLTPQRHLSLTQGHPGTPRTPSPHFRVRQSSQALKPAPFGHPESPAPGARGGPTRGSAHRRRRRAEAVGT